jgi:hypothetical protein
MEDSELYMELLKDVEANKYKLIQIILREGKNMSKISPEFNPFYAGEFIIKVNKNLLKEPENSKE